MVQQSCLQLFCLQAAAPSPVQPASLLMPRQNEVEAAVLHQRGLCPGHTGAAGESGIGVAVQLALPGRARGLDHSRSSLSLAQLPASSTHLISYCPSVPF